MNKQAKPTTLHPITMAQLDELAQTLNEATLQDDEEQIAAEIGQNGFILAYGRN